MATSAIDGRALAREEIGLGDLRQEALQLMLLVVAALAFAQLFAAGALLPGLDGRPAYPAIALASLAATCHWLTRRSPRLASALLVGGMVAVIGLCESLFPPLPLAAAVVLPILAAVALLG